MSTVLPEAMEKYYFFAGWSITLKSGMPLSIRHDAPYSSIGMAFISAELKF